MVNVRTPRLQIHKAGLWPPKNHSLEYTITDADNWWKVAEKFNVDVWDLIEFNFRTRIPEEVNWYMRELIGCHHTNDGKNYSFLGADPKKRKIYIPPLKAPPPEETGYRKKTYEEVIAALKLEIDATTDPRKSRYLCMISKLEQGADDRVIFWNHIAPDHRIVAPLGIVRRRDITISMSAVDQDWLFKTIKTSADVEIQPRGSGLGFNKFVTGLRTALHDPIDARLLQFREMHDQIVETHRTLENWSNVGIGGSSSMPRDYRAIKEWVKLQTNNTKTVLNCVISSGLKRP